MFFSMFFSGKLSCFKDGNFEIEHLVCAFVGQEDWIQHVQGDTTTVSVFPTDLGECTLLLLQKE